MTTREQVDEERRAWVEQIMGMPVSVHLRGAGSRSPEAEAAVQAGYDELRAIDVLFSPYRVDSEVSRIDAGALTEQEAHPLVREVIDLCRIARDLTRGAFDAWRPGDAGMRFDPTGLVKGWAVQRAASHLAGAVAADVCVNAGGDLALRPGAAAGKWRVGIEDPQDATHVLAVVPMVSGGVATSGTSHRGGHIEDPADGAPVTHALAATVVGPSLMWADVLATAVFVRGSAGLAMVADLAGYEALVVDLAGRVTMTSGLRVA